MWYRQFPGDCSCPPNYRWSQARPRPHHVIPAPDRLTHCPIPINDGPIARIITRLAEPPRVMKPPIKTLFPVPTLSRVEMLASRAPVGVDS